LDDVLIIERSNGGFVAFRIASEVTTNQFTFLPKRDGGFNAIEFLKLFHGHPRSGFTPLASITSSLNVTCRRAAPPTNVFSGLARPPRTTVKRNDLMKLWFTSKAISKGGRSEGNQTSNGLQNATSGILRAGKPTLTGLDWSPQSGGSPMPRQDESAFMQSQLG
jgi:hypothetical protein